jgi:hypothetical protein
VFLNVSGRDWSIPGINVSRERVAAPSWRPPGGCAAFRS